jgi:predicted DNA-binding transcriptional regulator YafY
MQRAWGDPAISRASLQELMAKLPKAFPPPLQPLVRRTLSEPTDAHLGPGPEIFACLASALVRQQPVKLCYLAREGAGTLAEPIVDPEILLPFQRSWYLIGRCHQRKRVVMFCLDRLASATTEL